MQKKSICLALDGLSLGASLNLAEKLGSQCYALKIHDLFDAMGVTAVTAISQYGAKPWIDYKLHDTKDTVGLRVKALIQNGAKVITVHASGGVPMMKAAVAASQAEFEFAEIWAITVLTSLDDDEIARIYGKDRTREQIVHEFALMAKEAGIRTVVCSAQEVGMLSQSADLAGMQFTVPGTRSAGVALGQQKRSGTPAQASADGATFLVAGSQVTKAENPVAAFNAMAAEIAWPPTNPPEGEVMDTVIWKNGSHLIVTGDFLKTLENCQGHYVCPVSSDGKLFGPVVGYAAEYEPGKKWVGLEYFNFSQADQWPAVLMDFARQMFMVLDESVDKVDLIVGAPWAGVKFSQAVALAVGCRHIFAEKDCIGFDENGKKVEKLILGRYEGMIKTGDKVLIGEELVNNASTTAKLIALIEEVGGEVIGITCAINRSFPFRNSFQVSPERAPIPIISVIERSTPQYRQDDPMVAGAIAAGNVVWKPKYAWDQMRAAMDGYLAAQGERS